MVKSRESRPKLDHFEHPAKKGGFGLKASYPCPAGQTVLERVAGNSFSG